MMYNFDGQNRIISLDLGVIDFEVIDLYSRWKDWVITGNNGKYKRAFSVVGGEPIDTAGTQVISPYFFLDNGWKLRPQEADHQLTINGNLLTTDGTQPTILTLGGFEVYVRTVLSVNATTTTINSGSGLSVEQSEMLERISKILEADEVREADGTITRYEEGTLNVIGNPKQITQDCETKTASIIKKV